MRVPKQPGDLINEMHYKMAHPKKKKAKKQGVHKHKVMCKEDHSKHKKSPLTGMAEGSKADMKEDAKLAKHMHKGKKHHKMTVPKTAMGKAQVKKLGRTKKTGGFAKIAASAGKEYGSKAAGNRVAGAIFQNMVRARKGK